MTAVGGVTAEPAEGQGERPSQHDNPARSRARLLSVLAVVILAAALGLRLWHLDQRPGTEYDEPVYSSVAKELSTSGALEVRHAIGVDEPYLYHPPFYFLALAGAFKVFGASLVVARVWAVLWSIVSLGLLWLFLRTWPGGRAGLVVLALVATDGWLMYTNRVSWIENTAVPFMLLGLLLYRRARQSSLSLDPETLGRTYAAAGYVLGFAMIIKLNLAVGLLAVAIHWIIVRGDVSEHVRLFRGAFRVVFAYVAVMILIYGRDFVRQVTVQFDRSTGTYASRGTVHFTDLVGAFTHNYAVFLTTLAFVVFAVGLLAAELFAAFRVRPFSLGNLQGPNSLYLAWSLAAVIFLGALSLKYPQYILLLLLPLYLYAGGRIASWYRARPDAARRGAVAVAASVLLVGNGVAYATQVVTARTDTIAAAAAYVGRLPHRALLLADEPIGVSIPQRYENIDLWVSDPHARSPAYVAVITTRTQKLPTSRRFRRLLHSSTVRARFHGFKGDVTVYETCAPEGCGPG